MRWLLRCVVGAIAAKTVDSNGAPMAGFLKASLKRVTDRLFEKYNMSIAIAFHSPVVQVAVASGFTDAGLGMGSPKRQALPDDVYVWGSTTKMFTGAAVMQLVDAGVVHLEDPIGMHVDPILQGLNGTTLSQRFGDWINGVTVGHLLHMTSGIADYDGDQYTADQFADRSRDFGPVYILSHYVSTTPMFRPGSKQSYCSTNYILLGLVLASHARHAGSEWTWQEYDQTQVIPRALRRIINRSAFIDAGTCKDHSPVHGFLESYGTSSIPAQDAWDISCVGGWTAGNFVGPVADVARFTYALYNKRTPQVVSASAQAIMTNFSAPSPFWMPKFKFYGAGTFSLDWSVGDAEAYGHVGDTYGYQSQTTYFPSQDFVLAVATNIETTKQSQPGEATCLAYHEVVATLQGSVPPTCQFDVKYKFVGKCSCEHTGKAFLV